MCWQNVVPSHSSYPSALHSPLSSSQHLLNKVIGSSCSATAACLSLERPLASAKLPPVVRHKRAMKPVCPAATGAHAISQAAGTGNRDIKREISKPHGAQNFTL